MTKEEIQKIVFDVIWKSSVNDINDTKNCTNLSYEIAEALNANKK